MTCTWYAVCPMKYFTDAGLLDPKWVNTYCKGDWRSCVRYRMESRGQPHPDHLLPDGSLEESLRGR